ncbi:helix-turn-helix domain-containing protein [Antrihabitans spumae]|uniref:Helix-turn-helix domain-containing protein n=1 Tax=Antrihabitans spumae TaxID=3373370 RepID=A0ABW7JXM3_9NOCA
MNEKQSQILAELLRSKRTELGLSASETARRAGIQPSTLTRLELGQIAAPTATNLRALGTVLGITSADLFATVGWMPEGELPSMTPYLRSKYRNMPPEAIAEIEQHFAKVAKDHGITVSGPAGTEDE